MIKNYLKKFAASVLGKPTIFSCFSKILKLKYHPFIRVVSYHDTPACFESQLEKHLAWFKDNYVNCDKPSLDAFLKKSVWGYDKPGIIITFDDGLRTNFTVAVRLLEKYHFTGWFMVPATVPALTSPADRLYAKNALIPHSEVPINERIFMSWEELKTLSKNHHEIVCHSHQHKRLSMSLSPSEMEFETKIAKSVMEMHLQRNVNAFAWVGGEDYSYSHMAFDYICQAGFDLIFSTNCLPLSFNRNAYCIERSHLDCSYSLDEVRFVLGGVYDVMYWAKRNRVRQKLGVSQ